MKRVLGVCSLSIFLVGYSGAQNVGIGTTSPVAGLHIVHNNGIIAKGDTLSSNPYVLTETGAGAKLIWHPKKAAFMVGRLDNFGDVPHRWDEDSIGFGAMNLGYANIVKGEYSFATGIGNIVGGGGFGSIAMGHGSFADSNECVAIGFGAEARQRQAVAIGTGVVANGRSSFATGYVSNASGYVSTAGGFYSVASGDYSFSNGYNSTAKGIYSFSDGYVNYSGAPNSFTAGYQDSVYDFPSPYGGARSAAAFGWGNKVRGAFAITSGTFNIIDSGGYNSVALGYSNRTGGNEAIALGGANQATGLRSVAIGSGNSVYGDYSIAIGENSGIPIGNINAIVLGKDAQANCSGCIIMGSTISPSANIGIGNSNPSHARLEVNGSIGDAVAIFGSDKFGTTIKADYPGIGFNFYYNSGNYTIKAGHAALMEMNSTTGDIYVGGFNGNQSSSNYGSISGYRQIITLLQNGNVGIGITTPAATLDVQKTASSTTLVNFKGTTHYSHFMFGVNEDTYIRGGLNSSNVIINDVNTTGGVVIGSGSILAGDKLTLYGNFKHWGNNNTLGNISVTGNICATGSIGACSDIRYKTNISFVENALQKIRALHAIYYNWKQDKFPQMHFNNERQLGLSAQEVEKFFPEIVQTNADGYKAVDYSRLTPILIEGMKEQQQQIEILQKENESLKGRLERLEKIILNK